MSKCLVGPKFITEVNGETGPSINLTPDKVGGLSEYICVTTGTNHELTGIGNNIKFIADADYNEGNTITVNGSIVTTKLQNGEPLSSDAWIAGAVVTCYLNGDVLNFKGGNGLNSEDKAKLIPENIRKGITLFSGTSQEVVGTAMPFSMFAKGQANGDTWGSWMNAKSTTYTVINGDFVATNGQATITVKKKGYYRFYVVFAAIPDNNNQDSLLGFQFLKDGAVISGTSFNNLRGPTIREFAMLLNENDVLTWQIYVRHVATIFHTFLFVYKEHD